ncbi:MULTISPECIES: HEAT repeat domain-containing protein [unclassified Cyanobium]|uniref:HEAT repeat domain-containing protein n=1 Tax=unclassified Cyanobium TaxID=2627006 RepID=UPI0020CF3011|nr:MULTISPECIES: HEAT repeat domain-containing protein [unclassified Cyanobium]
MAARIAALQQAGSALALLQATQELASCADASAAPVLVEVLGFNNPGAAVAAVNGLISLGTAAVEALLQLDPDNYGARAWAVRALAGIGDVRGLELLLDALGSDVAASVRRAAAKGLGQLQLGALAEAEQHQVRQRCLAALLAATADGEWVVRYAVAVGLESLAEGLSPDATELQQARNGLVTLSEATEDTPPVVQRRAKLALSRLEPQ